MAEGLRYAGPLGGDTLGGAAPGGKECERGGEGVCGGDWENCVPAIKPPVPPPPMKEDDASPPVATDLVTDVTRVVLSLKKVERRGS